MARLNECILYRNFEHGEILDKMAEGKSVNLDIFAKDAFGNLYDLEMQNFCRSDEELDLRTRTYERMLDVHCMKRGVKNKKLPYTNGM